jgi:proteasome lid subunit RPN8/RPN11
MSFFKVQNSSPPVVEFAAGVWTALMDDLRVRGQGRRESGAFLLADADATQPVITSWLPYDELAPESLAYAYVRLEPEAFTRLWAYCADKRVKVVADIHTHPKGPGQSPSDKKHPMVAFAGHVALIAPWFAQRSLTPRDVSLNVYQGGGKWLNYFNEDAAARISAPK